MKCTIDFDRLTDDGTNVVRSVLWNHGYKDCSTPKDFEHVSKYLSDKVIRQIDKALKPYHFKQPESQMTLDEVL